MREYKFRYYKKSIKQMVPVRSMYFGEPELGGRGISVNDGLELIADSELMQFTGLKDKNGRDIYEGDIVIDVEEYGDDKSRWRVDFGEGHYDDGYYKFQGFHLVPLNNPGWDEEHTRMFDAKIQVIGNIYEHGDLLK